MPRVDRGRFPQLAPPFLAGAGADPFPVLGKGFVVALACYVVVAVPKTNALVPALDALKPGKILAAIVLLACLGTPLRDRLRAVFRTRPARAVALITLLMVLSVPTSVWPSHSLAYFTDQGIQTFFLFALSAAAFSDRRAVPIIVAAWVLGAGLGALRMLAPGALSVEGRVMMSFALDPNDSAALLVCTLPFALWMAARGGAARVLAVIAALASVLAIVKTGSRGGLIGLAAMGLLMLVVSPPRRRLAYLAIAVVGSAIVMTTASDDLRTRMSSIFVDDAKTEDYNFTDRDGRIEVWKRGIGYMVTHPLLGVGVDGFETADGTLSGKQNEGYGVRYTAAHNSFVQIGAELGVFGLASYIAAIVFAGTGLWRIRRRAIQAQALVPSIADPEIALAAAALSSLVGIMSAGFFLSFGYHPITMFVWAVCIGVIVGSPFASESFATEAPPISDAAEASSGVTLVGAEGTLPPAVEGGRRGARQRPVRPGGHVGWRSRGL